jgi:hypothetical protein
MMHGKSNINLFIYVYSIAGLYIPMISNNTLDTFTVANPLRICKIFIGTCVISGFRREVDGVIAA